MEKQTGRWKKVLGKGAFVVICILVALALLVGAIVGTIALQRCAGRSNTPAKAEPTATPEPTPIPERLYSAEKHLSEAPPIDTLGITQGHLEDFRTGLEDPTHWIVLTPEGAKGIEIIRSIDIGCSFLVQNGVYYRLGEGEDGKGVVDVILTDLNMDDEDDLLYTYHFGANEDECAKVGWFDLSTHESVLSDFCLKKGFFALNEEDGMYVLYRAARDADLETGTFGLNLIERLGEVTEENGRLLLLLEASEEP